MSNLVNLVKVNNLAYNPNRDPQVYRRSKGENFRIQALLKGSGTAKATMIVDGEACCAKNIALPGTFECQVSFKEAGTRVGELVVEANGENFTQSIRLDVEEHAPIG